MRSPRQPHPHPEPATPTTPLHPSLTGAPTRPAPAPRLSRTAPAPIRRTHQTHARARPRSRARPADPPDPRPRRPSTAQSGGPGSPAAAWPMHPPTQHPPVPGPRNGGSLDRHPRWSPTTAPLDLHSRQPTKPRLIVDRAGPKQRSAYQPGVRSDPSSADLREPGGADPRDPAAPTRATAWVSGPTGSAALTPPGGAHAASSAELSPRGPG